MSCIGQKCKISRILSVDCGKKVTNFDKISQKRITIFVQKTKANNEFDKPVVGKINFFNGHRKNPHNFKNGRIRNCEIKLGIYHKKSYQKVTKFENY